jgi:group I intron endonuclease
VGIVYLLTNKQNGKVYVGQTTHTLERRWKLHISASNGPSQRIIHRAIRKYGSVAFSQQVLAEAKSPEELDALEIRYISEYNSQNSAVGYNCAAGGSNPRAGARHSEETRGKLREAWRRKKARGYKLPETFTTKGRKSWNAGGTWTEAQRTLLMQTRKSGWTTERRAAQAERARKQGFGGNTSNPIKTAQVVAGEV